MKEGATGQLAIGRWPELKLTLLGFLARSQWPVDQLAFTYLILLTPSLALPRPALRGCARGRDNCLQ